MRGYARSDGGVRMDLPKDFDVIADLKLGQRVALLPGHPEELNEDPGASEPREGHKGRKAGVVEGGRIQLMETVDERARRQDDPTSRDVLKIRDICIPVVQDF